MKITLEHLKDTCYIKTEKNNLEPTEILRHFCNLMLCAGWQQGSIDEAIMALNEQIDL